MNILGLLKKIGSYFLPVLIKEYISAYSGKLTIMLENGKKVLNTEEVNYSFNSLHRVFKQAFKRSQINISPQANAIIFGLGGGSIVQILRDNYKLIRPITIVEIDPIIIEIAKKEFNIHKYDPLEIIEMDAFEFVNHHSQSYDLICMDVFINDQVPEKFLGFDFLQNLLQSLQTGGTLFYNLMISNPKYQLILENIVHFLDQKKGIELVSFSVLALEGNNRMLIVNK